MQNRKLRTGRANAPGVEAGGLGLETARSPGVRNILNTDSGLITGWNGGLKGGKGAGIKFVERLRYSCAIGGMINDG